MPSLLDMPDLAMRLILEKSDFRSIQNLRKSCRDLRLLIEDLQPESNCTTFCIKFGRDFINSSIYFERGPQYEKFSIFYRKTDDGGCEIDPCGKVLEDSDFLSVAFRDAQLLLDSSSLDVFALLQEQASTPISELLELLEDHLKVRKAALKVKDFTIEVEKAEQVLCVLPYLDPQELQILNLNFSRFSGTQEVSATVTRQIGELAQWKSATELHSYNFFKENIQAENLVHFETVHLDVNDAVVSWKMVLKLKEAFLVSPHMKHFQLKYAQCDAEPELERLYGAPFISNFLNQKIWFFAVPEDPDHAVFIRINSIYVVIERIEIDEVQEGAIVTGE